MKFWWTRGSADMRTQETGGTGTAPVNFQNNILSFLTALVATELSLYSAVGVAAVGLPNISLVRLTFSSEELPVSH